MSNSSSIGLDIQKCDIPLMSHFARISPRHEGEGESDNEHLQNVCGALDPVTGQIVNRGDVRDGSDCQQK